MLGWLDPRWYAVQVLGTAGLELTGGLKKGLLALAVGAGLQVMAGDGREGHRAGCARVRVVRLHRAVGPTGPGTHDGEALDRAVPGRVGAGRLVGAGRGHLDVE